jgi:hypothetical protein
MSAIHAQAGTISGYPTVDAPKYAPLNHYSSAGAGQRPGWQRWGGSSDGHMQTYDLFLEERRRLMAKKIESWFKAL